MASRDETHLWAPGSLRRLPSVEEMDYVMQNPVTNSSSGPSTPRSRLEPPSSSQAQDDQNLQNLPYPLHHHHHHYHHPQSLAAISSPMGQSMGMIHSHGHGMGGCPYSGVSGVSGLPGQGHRAEPSLLLPTPGSLNLNAQATTSAITSPTRNNSQGVNSVAMPGSSHGNSHGHAHSLSLSRTNSHSHANSHSHSHSHSHSIHSQPYDPVHNLAGPPALSVYSWQQNQPPPSAAHAHASHVFSSLLSSHPPHPPHPPPPPHPHWTSPQHPHPAPSIGGTRADFAASLFSQPPPQPSSLPYNRYSFEGGIYPNAAGDFGQQLPDPFGPAPWSSSLRASSDQHRPVDTSLSISPSRPPPHHSFGSGSTLAMSSPNPTSRSRSNLPPLPRAPSPADRFMADQSRVVALPPRRSPSPPRYQTLPGVAPATEIPPTTASPRRMPSPSTTFTQSRHTRANGSPAPPQSARTSTESVSDGGGASTSASAGAAAAAANGGASSSAATAQPSQTPGSGPSAHAAAHGTAYRVAIVDPSGNVRAREGMTRSPEVQPPRRGAGAGATSTMEDEPSDDEDEGESDGSEVESMDMFLQHVTGHVTVNPNQPPLAYREAAEERVRTQQLLRGAMTNKRVASKTALTSLQSVDIASLPESERTCVICYNEFGVENPEGINEAPLRLPKCKHVFGDHCIKKWFEESDSCPYCRDKVPSEPMVRINGRTMRNLLAMGGAISPNAALAAHDQAAFLRAYQAGAATPAWMQAARSEWSAHTRRSPPEDIEVRSRRTRPRHGSVRESSSVALAGGSGPSGASSSGLNGGGATASAGNGPRPNSLPGPEVGPWDFHVRYSTLGGSRVPQPSPQQAIRAQQLREQQQSTGSSPPRDPYMANMAPSHSGPWMLRTSVDGRRPGPLSNPSRQMPASSQHRPHYPYPYPSAGPNRFGPGPSDAGRPSTFMTLGGGGGAAILTSSPAPQPPSQSSPSVAAAPSSSATTSQDPADYSSANTPLHSPGQQQHQHGPVPQQQQQPPTEAAPRDSPAFGAGIYGGGSGTGIYSSSPAAMGSPFTQQLPSLPHLDDMSYLRGSETGSEPSVSAGGPALW